MSKTRIGINQVMKHEFYQLPKLLILDKKYRESLSDGAKLLYMIIRDRFALSANTTKAQIEAGNTSPTYLDNKGHIFCFLDNLEMAFTLNKSVKTAIKFMDELEEMELVSIEQVEGEANRIYLNNLDSPENKDILITFLGERDYFKHVQSRKKKKKEPKLTLEQCIALQASKRKGQADSSEGCKNETPRDNTVAPTGDVNVTPLGTEEITPLGVEPLHPNENDLKEPEFKDTDINNTNLNNSSKMNEDKPLEEEQTKPVQITIDDNYALLDTFKPLHELCPDLRALNVVKKTLKAANINSFYLSDLKNAMGSHALNVLKYKRKGEEIAYIPAFFANNLVDRIHRNEVRRKAQNLTKQGTSLPANKIEIFDVFSEGNVG